MATDDELADLAEQINKDSENTHTMINQIISHLQVTDSQLERLTKAASQVETAFKALTHHVRKTDTVLANMKTEVVFGQTLNFLAFAALETQAEVQKIISAIEMMVQTMRVNPLFLPPKVFSETLVKLQDEVRLFRPPTANYLPFFYDT